ncbi:MULTISPECIES: GH116 family glycosyl-hydrolase [unclassified Microbacterium]|uniref:GH116 family glycosyl-hydrolase n=1 Tax=unclassified Microbacterium TaxID=2609290 RepID=UPI000CFDDC1B|nr:MULTISPECIES: GH116 family glycosyl-hydrolase [unclassified Microbacterium]PQZ54568.1 hypothetical protein CQ032_13440 [Microbacterium sp. MYb43]PQZ74269.1 hypothetical protein CQ031_16090 [Microbacterium sp. MYb40]PRB17132.1 hypothetical protein CQ040_17945 [Microbacterium sp. MYb54]PRB25282.1 hypothetical protein CQ037_15385 [Microbacterium sp. MYb50]PRB63787.1 hypothetical protein CQ021_15735 [Microbacterium sp. MYb24]
MKSYAVSAPMMTHEVAWPAQRRYSGDALRRVVMPLGGIGTGTIGLGGNGRLTDWEIGDHPATGAAPRIAHVVARVSGPTGTTITALEGPLDDADVDGPFGARIMNHGLPRFREAEFAAAYPLASLTLRDDDVPVAVTLRAFNPMIPGDVEASSLPLAMLRYRVENTSADEVEVTLSASIAHPLGDEASKRTIDVHSSDAFTALRFRAEGGRVQEQGTFALGVFGGASVSWRRSWPEHHFGDALLDYWDDLEDDALTDPERPGSSVGSLATTTTVPAGAHADIVFVLAWHLPRRRAWKWIPQEFGDDWSYEDDVFLENHYTRGFTDALDVLTRTVPQLPDLERRTVAFVQAFTTQDAPDELREAALSAVSVLRSQTVFRTADGHFFGWEGCGSTEGSCHGNCTHVWHYEYATSHLFGELARSMRELEFLHATDEGGKMSFRIGLPLETHAREWPYAAADGQMGAVVRLYHDWRLSGDEGWLRRLYPAARRAMEFCWIDGGWDADQDGLMEGVQHNTYDVEFYGPSPQMQGWYLAALAASVAMAETVGDEDFARRCAGILASGRLLTESTIFNGEYYQQHVRPLREGQFVADGLRRVTETDAIGRNPVSQLGPGCLVDQLVGDTAAELAGIGGQLARQNVRTAAFAVYRHNRRERADRTLNHMRSFAVGDEPSLIVCSYPRGDRPAIPFPYCSEAMTGFEYAAATALIQSGADEQGLQVVRDVRARFDGRRRNPFDEMEAGRHYARSMASWGTMLAWQGLRMDAVTATLHLARRAERFRQVWTDGFGWGEVEVDGDRITVSVAEGELVLGTIVFPSGARWRSDGPPVRVRAGEPLDVVIGL